MNRLSLRLDGSDISMDAFIEAADAFLALLKGIDRSVHGQRTIRWRLAELSYSSPAIVVCEGRSSRKDILDDPTPRTAEALLDGIEAMERQSLAPPEFSDEVLEQARVLGSLRGAGGIANVTLVGMNEVPTTQPRSVPITQRVAAAVDDVLGAKYRALGSVEGRLEVISIHRRTFFNIYESVHDRRVRCLFNPDQLEDAKAALGHKVIVEGEVLSNARGHPVTIKVKRFERFPAPDELPSVGDISGIDPGFTGGVESSQYVRERWNGDQG